METQEHRLTTIQFGEVKLDAGQGTDQGKERENNEDKLLFVPERGLFIVCDGIGGMNAGERAAEQAIATLDRVLDEPALETSRQKEDKSLNELMTRAIHVANDEIRVLQQERRMWNGMGCTVVAGALQGGNLHLTNLGDSRAYLLRNGTTEPQVLTSDHTVAAELVKQGDLSAEEARHHMLRNQLTSALGHLDPKYPPYSITISLQTGDRIVLCSDGLWDMVKDAEIARITLNAPSAQRAADDLIVAANEAGGDDNITVIVLHVLEIAATSFHSVAPPAGVVSEDLNRTLERKAF